MELQLKYLAPYLPYGLKLKVFDDFFKYEIMTLCDKSGLSNISIADVIDEQDSFKPILRLMDDIHDYFIPLFNSDNPDIFEFLSDEFLKDYDIDCTSEILNFSVEYLPYGLVDLLLKHHFDVFGLIEKGLAVDINTLSVQNDG